MNKSNLIKQFFAFWLLILFTISIIPKVYFHDAIANHKDTTATCNHPEKPKNCVHQQGYNCQVNDPVISSPYLEAAITGWWLPKIYFDTSPALSCYSFLQDCLILKENRGPPLG